MEANNLYDEQEEKNKIYIIQGEVYDDGSDKDGCLETLRGNDVETHAYYLSEFLANHYQNIPLFKKFNDDFMRK